MEDKQIQESPIQEIICSLKEKVGSGITAYLAGVRKKETLDKWLAGKRVPSSAQRRLRCAKTVVWLIAERYGAETAKSWLFGRNTHLNEKAPAYIIRYTRSEHKLSEIVLFARGFTNGSWS